MPGYSDVLLGQTFLPLPSTHCSAQEASRNLCVSSHPTCKIQKLLQQTVRKDSFRDVIQSMSYAQWRCWGVLTSESKVFSLYIQRFRFGKQSFSATPTVLFLYSTVQKYFFPRWLGSKYFLVAVIFFTYVTQFVKLSTFNQSLGHSSDVQIQSFLSFYFYKKWRCWCAESSYHAMGYCREGGIEDDSKTSKGPLPFECLWCVTKCDVQMSIMWLWNSEMGTCDVL